MPNNKLNAETIKQAYKQGQDFAISVRERREKVASLIKHLRKNNNITQAQLCDAIGVNRITYSGYENCRAEPSIEVLVRIADYFHISMDYLTGRDIQTEQDSVKNDTLLKLKELEDEITKMRESLASTNK